MGDNFQILEILVFAVIAGILVFRLRSVLGRRTGTEKRRDLPFSGAPKPPAPAATATVLPLPVRPRAGVTIDGTDSASAIRAADPSFDAATFLDGARGAFQIIVQAFAAADRAKLQPLLSPDVFKSFSGAIDAREQAKEKQDTRIVAIKGADIAQTRLEGGTALVTVKFVSDQIMATRSEAGAVVDGDPDKAIEHTDVWTFSRIVRSPDPNWILIATETPTHP